MLSDRLNRTIKFEKQTAPSIVTFEVTNACNYHCYFCAHDKMTRPIKFMDFNSGKKYLQDLYDSGIKELGFNECGEPVLHNDIAKFVFFAKKLGFNYIYITSNGSIPDDARYLSLLDAGIDSIKFSINASNNIDYAKIHKTSETTFNEVINRLNLLADYRNKNNLPTKIYASCVSDDPHTVDKLNTLLHIDEVVPYKIGSQSRQVNPAHCNPTKKICNIPFSRSHITAEGFVNICCIDFQNFLAVGDLNKENFLSIWNGEVYNNVREKFLKNDYSGLLCHGCINSQYIKAAPLCLQFATLPQIIPNN